MKTKPELKNYINTSIEAKCEAKINYHQWELLYYWHNRHKGLAGIDADQVKCLLKFQIRQVRIWREIQNRCFPPKIDHFNLPEERTEDSKLRMYKR